ncbi:uncharacterized protein LOC127724348 isoform X1 [Mytilus californianus]|uniref:uncharacterized protein LOC127724348 isoform X1 n=1 Tax=Mytilus californianus TaxID=6549 RepID=UPI002246B85D|nr:uncharacterized protein LOC127724348 isoform X1 [Mytilus californianus]
MSDKRNQSQEATPVDEDDNDVMITEVTSAPSFPTKPIPRQSTTTNRKHMPPTNALNVMTKMGLNTTNPKILQALKVMQGTKSKRGPKEKATFQRYIYCLPDKSSKLPRFSSSDETERAIVKQHQDQGFGYPQNDYNSGLPSRTKLDLYLTQRGFDSFLRNTYPKLAKKNYDIYKIDKQRRLLRIATYTPRAIKDTKYQGSLIIIPYDDPSDRPPGTLYRYASGPEEYMFEYSVMVSPRNKDDALNSSQTQQSDEASLTFSDQQQQLTDAITSSVNTILSHESQNKNPEATETEQFVIKIETDSSDAEMETTVSSSKVIQEELPRDTTHKEADTSQPAGLKDLFGIFERTEHLRNQLKDNVFYIHIDDNDLVHSILQVYRQYLNILEHKVVVCCINHQVNENERHQQNPIQPYLVRFWDEIFDLCFEGDKEKIPICSSDMPEDIFLILGRVMYHGLILQNYWPVRFSQACCSIIITDTVSDKQLAESFQKVLSDDQKNVVAAAKAEIRSGVAIFDLATQVNLCRTLRSYGNTTKPDPSTLNECLMKLAKFSLIQRPYWCLSQIRCGLQTIHGNLFQNVEEKDVFMFYSALTPSALSLFDKIVYLFSTCDEDPELEIEEKRVKIYLENFIMSFHSSKLAKLLLRWCQTDCLNSTHVYVRFAKSSVCQRPIFDADVSTMTLSSVYTSQEEFSLIMSQEI